ncbi:Tlp-20 [Ectropis obliqua nucleopolyhedrovirus]|uniref:Telokin-like protein 20 n=1 Tax=Ectropis obliqua nucleopolyhedrovirus TaxID=59376 RepID=A0EYW8_9ABAC|nr:Tlp-20 [Ectropis obliqua nucleopolyhedrovirus]ABI35748.1 Tlp-20 [Ectropis obliqua nucleopolyhedrovirus]AGS47920.1 telokin-like protein 20 [Ectropis obliqua nucleopolyhedrovirus]QWV59666.1 Tlp-20 [Ectropis obliqua nucleopolyhedrovirus]UYO72863.1 Tlp-20 [Ectropis obliqua nucleopolyhedrovirus]
MIRYIIKKITVKKMATDNNGTVSIAVYTIVDKENDYNILSFIVQDEYHLKKLAVGAYNLNILDTQLLNTLEESSYHVVVCGDFVITHNIVDRKYARTPNTKLNVILFNCKPVVLNKSDCIFKIVYRDISKMLEHNQNLLLRNIKEHLKLNDLACLDDNAKNECNKAKIETIGSCTSETQRDRVASHANSNIVAAEIVDDDNVDIVAESEFNSNNNNNSNEELFRNTFGRKRTADNMDISNDDATENDDSSESSSSDEYDATDKFTAIDSTFKKQKYDNVEQGKI